MEQVLRVVIELLTFGTVFAATIAIWNSAREVWKLRRRLGLEAALPLAGGGGSGGAQSGALFQGRELTNRFLKWVQSSTSISNAEEGRKLRRDLSLAGFESPSAPVWYVTIRFGLAIALPIAFLIAMPMLSVPLNATAQIVWPLMLCFVGLLAPRSFIDRSAASRRTRLEFEFPDALDLMVVCVEAGLSLEAAFVRVGQEVESSHPRIVQEFGRVSEELRAGRVRADALRAMADRADVAGVRSFTNLLIQTEALGTSIAQTLRTYSVEMREGRLLRAEEKALRIPVLMTVPLVACILPVIITSLLLPAIIDVVRTLLPALMASHGG